MNPPNSIETDRAPSRFLMWEFSGQHATDHQRAVMTLVTIATIEILGILPLVALAGTDCAEVQCNPGLIFLSAPTLIFAPFVLAILVGIHTMLLLHQDKPAAQFARTGLFFFLGTLIASGVFLLMGVSY